MPAFIATILSSRAFEKSPALRNLLVYLWLNRNEQVSEYAVATNALGRSASFDPKIDATVRVQISRLRQRLEKYYRDEGAGCRERLTIPLGSHSLGVETMADAPLEAVRPAVLDPPPARVSREVRILRICCALLGIAAAGLGVLASSRGTAPARQEPPVPRFWTTFFASHRPTRIILPTPVFFSWTRPDLPQNAPLMFRDTEINLFDDGAKSRDLMDLERRYGNPTLAQNYTVASDTFAAVRLARYLDRTGFETAVLTSASAPLAALDRENVIAFGTWGTLTPLRPYLDRMSFELASHETRVVNRKPQKGEPARIEQKTESTQRIVYPGIIAVLPGGGKQTRLLILTSRCTAALVAFLTSNMGLHQLDRLWKSKGSPPFYEVVVATEMNGDELASFHPVLLHPFVDQP